jgi:hypothetical protein
METTREKALEGKAFEHMSLIARKWHAIHEVVAFCEEHGGSLSGEKRTQLESLCCEVFALGVERGAS